MPLWGWEWEAAFKYNRDTGAKLIIVNEDMLVNKDYQKQIENEGVKLVPSDNKNQSIAAKETAQSVIRLNDVWTTVTTDPSTFGCKVVHANHDIDLAPLPNEQLIASLIAHPPWLWKPYSPYDIFTTQILESQSWQYVVVSNYSLFFFADWGGGFLFVYWLMLKYIEKQNKKNKEKKDAITR